MSSPSRYPSHADAVRAGWFSRRHETNAAHRAAQDKWQAERLAKAEREEQARIADELRRAERKRNQDLAKLKLNAA
jgi:hypothetical protein